MTPRSATFTTCAALAWLVILTLSGCTTAPTHQSYATPEEAAAALVAAAKSGDRAQLEAVFGPDAEVIITSGDPVADAGERKAFVTAYEAKHTLVPEGEDRRTLEVGAEDWPLPVPIVKRDGRWYLDGAAGAEEVAYRRIGRNELGAIAVCLGYVDAQLEYGAVGHDGLPAGIYAQKLLSDEGAHNGLYWKSEPGEPESPVGPAVATAAAEGYRAGAGRHAPYHGYRYRPLYAQGPNAEGGAADYFVNGYLVRGFALVAWPAEYRVSGVQTFIVNQAGTVYQKDLGMDTAGAVETIRTFDPDSTWSVVAEEIVVDADSAAAGE